MADALLARELPNGRLQLIDGHLRAETMRDDEVPVLILDLDEAEADKLLLTLDPLAAMASADTDRLDELLDSVRTDDPAIQALLDDLRAQEGLLLESLNDLADPEPQIDQAPRSCVCKWGTEAGQLWQVGAHRLICGGLPRPEHRPESMGRRPQVSCALLRSAIRHRLRAQERASQPNRSRQSDPKADRE